MIRQFLWFVLVAALNNESLASDTIWLISPSPQAGFASTDTGNPEKHGNVISLDEALRRLQALNINSQVSQPQDSIQLQFLPGTYRITTPVMLDAGNIAAHEYKISFSGPSDKSAIISGGKVLDRASPVTDPVILKQLSPEARSNIVQYDLRVEGITDFGVMLPQGFNQLQLGHNQELMPGSLELFYRGKPMTLARWPNASFALIGGAVDNNKYSFRSDSPHLEKLAGEDDLMVAGYFSADWAFETFPVASVDTDKGTIWIKSPGPKRGIKDGQRYFIQNALSELDLPGEWYLVRPTGILYFWPPAPLNPGEVEVSVAPSLLITKGINNLHVTGITFEESRGDAIRILNGNGIVIEHSTIRNTGGRAALVSGSNSQLRDLDVYDTGEGGIYLRGGDRQTLQPSGLTVEQSRFRRYSRLSRTYRPAIQLGGVGAIAIGNVISDAPHNAIMFFGNDHLIAYNEIFDVAKETGDVGAIYASRDWSARGTVIRNNFLHDIHGPGLHGSRGIYLDDQTSGVTVKGNLFVRVDRPIFIGGGRDNVIQNNVMIASSPAIHVDARGLTWQSAETQTDAVGGYRDKLSAVPYDKSPYSTRYPNLAELLNDEPGAPKYNDIKWNFIVDGAVLDIDKSSLKYVTVGPQITPGNAYFKSEPKAFSEIQPGDFRLEENLPALRQGFKQLPLNNMDCVTERWRRLDRGLSASRCSLH